MVCIDVAGKYSTVQSGRILILSSIHLTTQTPGVAKMEIYDSACEPGLIVISFTSRCSVVHSSPGQVVGHQNVIQVDTYKHSPVQLKHF